MKNKKLFKIDTILSEDVLGNVHCYQFVQTIVHVKD